jgi:hypothetical protein
LERAKVGSGEPARLAGAEPKDLVIGPRRMEIVPPRWSGDAAEAATERQEVGTLFMGSMPFDVPAI